MNRHFSLFRRWDNLDIDALAAEFGAESITKNGPQYWSMDTVSVKGSDERFDMSGADSECSYRNVVWCT